MHPSLSVFFKLANQALAANVTGISPSRLLFLTDRSSRLSFLVDTGAAVSVLPSLPVEITNPTTVIDPFRPSITHLFRLMAKSRFCLTLDFTEHFIGFL